MRRVSWIWILLFLSPTAFAQTARPVTFWATAVHTSSWTDFLDKFSDSTAPPWPRIETAYAYEQLSTDQRRIGLESLELAESFRALLQNSFRPSGGQNEGALAKELQALRRLNDALSRAGGYGNRVLQDSINRLMIFRLSQWLVENPKRARQVDGLFEMISVPAVNLDGMLAELASQDEKLAKNQHAISSISRDKSIYEALVPLGITPADVMDLTNPDTMQTSNLLRRTNALALVYRMATTEALKWVNLRGLIEFLQAGGSFAELNPADIRQFQARMGGKSKLHKYQLLGIRSLSEGHVLALVNLERGQDERRVFLKVCLE